MDLGGGSGFVVAHSFYTHHTSWFTVAWCAWLRRQLSDKGLPLARAGLPRLSRFPLRGNRENSAHPPLGLICLHGHRIPLSPEEPGGSPHACVQPLGVGLTRPAQAPPQKEVHVRGPLLYMCRWVDLMQAFMFSLVLKSSMVLMVLTVAQWCCSGFAACSMA